MTNYYPTIEEASKAVKKLNIKTVREYGKFHNEDPRLPRNPNVYYKKNWISFGKWNVLFGKEKFKAKVYYPTIEEASKAVKKLNIKTISEYTKRYQEDPKLTAIPYKLYQKDWEAFGKWNVFFGKKRSRVNFTCGRNHKKNIYPTIEEASIAAQLLGITTSMEYERKYILDDRLHSNPNMAYPNDWKKIGTWKGFLNTIEEKKEYYKTIEEASVAAQNLKIRTWKEYIDNYSKDILLPKNPKNTYKSKWNKFGGMSTFLNVNTYSIKEASIAAINLGINNRTEYDQRYNEDPRLPAIPSRTYGNNWKSFNGWVGFLNAHKYKTYKEASNALQKLGIESEDEYYSRFNEDSKLPYYPKRQYKNWNNSGGWKNFLAKPKEYSTIKEASDACVLFFIQDPKSYNHLRKKDPKLPENPEIFYKNEWIDFGGWDEFLDIGKYKTIQEAHIATMELKISNISSYKLLHKRNPKLPKYPSTFYKKDWKIFGGWKSFLNRTKYPTIIEASNAAKLLNISNREDYNKKRHQDVRLPASPSSYYNSDWIHFGGWGKFIDYVKPTLKEKRQSSYNKKMKIYGKTKESLDNYYPDISFASRIVSKLNIKTKEEYSKRHKEDPKLPPLPNLFYLNWNSFGDWYMFLNCHSGFLPTMETLLSECKLLEIKTIDDYKKAAINNTKIPSTPELFYSNKWFSYGGWEYILGTVNTNTYNIHDASKRAILLGATNRENYSKLTFRDPKMPSNPELHYEKQWEEYGGWRAFLKRSKVYYKNIKDASKAAIILNISSSAEYQELHYSDPCLPVSPSVFYKNWKEFGSWKAFLGHLNLKYNLSSNNNKYKYYKNLIQAVASIRNLNIRSFKAYKKEHKKDQQLPPNLPQFYKDEWVEFGGWNSVFNY
jgi:hypothetical protein